MKAECSQVGHGALRVRHEPLDQHGVRLELQRLAELIELDAALPVHVVPLKWGGAKRVR